MDFVKGQQIANYIIKFPIKIGEYTYTFRVKDLEGKPFFLKLIDRSKLHYSQVDSQGNITELEISKKLKHPNVSNYVDSGNIIIAGAPFLYIVYEFISGETVAEKIIRDQYCSVYDAKRIAIDVLKGLDFLHNLPIPIIHNEITTQNIMLKLTDSPSTPIIIDFGYARQLDENLQKVRIEGLNPFYLAPERFNGSYSVQSDLYSVGALIYHLLFGIVPWFIDLSKCKNSDSIDLILDARKTPLKILNTDLYELDEQLINTLSKALCQDPVNRFTNAADFIKALQGELKVDTFVINQDLMIQNQNSTKAKCEKKGNGFADVAGMQKLKEELQTAVIDIIKDPEGAKQYGLSMPNGMLLYGPPGCGKSFIAEKFAEETGFNYIYVKSSDLASIYVHGSQEKIGRLFDEARKNAPTILCFDEFDALVPSRDRMNNASQSGEVNEFLSQLNNCGNDRVFVIASTNKPDLIDPAILRRGRIDKIVYLPVPDKEARKGMFQLYLKNRPWDFGIDYDRLADLTENYVASDIKGLSDEAARFAWKGKSKITQQLLEDIINKNKPSVSKNILLNYETLRKKLEGFSEQTSRPKIGF